MLNIKLNTTYLESFIKPEDIEQEFQKNEQLFKDCLLMKFGQEDRKGWLTVDNHAHDKALDDILEVSKRIRKNAEVLVVIGIGGSNRGALAAIHGLVKDKHDGPEIMWAGNNLSGAYLSKIFDKIGERSVYIDVIAKDFNTIEPGLTFRMFRSYLKKRYKDTYHERIIVTGSEGKGQLKELAKRYNYTFLPFPENVGGRYSIMTPVGLLPIAVYGLDIKKLVKRAKETEKYLKTIPIRENPALKYAIIRKLLFEKGFQIESMCVFEPQLEYFARWWLQEFGETEGKGQHVIFPTYFVYSEDLHSMGQYIQEGRRFVFETFIKSFKKTDLMVPISLEDDGFDYMNGRAFDEANHAVYEAAITAHSQDGIPCIEFEIPEPDEAIFGELFYFFLFAVYCSANYIGVNPFDQNGVEGYKHNMYRILGK